MKVNGKNYRTAWMEGSSVFLIDQTLLPFEFKIYESKTHIDTCHAIKTMIVRGAIALGVTAGFAMAQAFLEAPKDSFWDYIENAKKDIEATRPTAQNLFYAATRIYNLVKKSTNPIQTAITEAQKFAEEDISACKRIGEYGNDLIKDNYSIQTHCNAGWLACPDYGTALSPIYIAHRSGKKVFVYVDETGPRNQGAKLTAWELKNEDVPYVIVPDSAGAYLMSRGKVDMIIVGADRIAKNGDVANKIGTFEKAIVAKKFGIPFYVAAPISTIDPDCPSGAYIPIEERSEEEVLYKTGLSEKGTIEKILVSSPGSKAINPAFDITPAEYITKIITEKGIIEPKEHSIKKLFY